MGGRVDGWGVLGVTVGALLLLDMAGQAWVRYEFWQGRRALARGDLSEYERRIENALRRIGHGLH
tara:strand:+ start:473 stop:667 length:195 start_codon:yes stop_codon:yes gene_type:complete